MKSLTLLVLAAFLAVAFGAGQYYVPRSYYVIDEEGHQSAPISLRRLRRSIFPSLLYGGANANANAIANANADGRGSANANAIANANANAHGGGSGIFRPGGIYGGGGGVDWPIGGGGGGGGIGFYPGNPSVYPGNPSVYPGGPGGSTGLGTKCYINCYVYPGSQVGSVYPNGGNNCCYNRPGLQVGSAYPNGGLGGMLVSRRSGTVTGASSVSAGSSVDVDGSGISRYDQYTAVGN